MDDNNTELTMDIYKVSGVRILKYGSSRSYSNDKMSEWIMQPLYGILAHMSSLDQQFSPTNTVRNWS